MHCFNSPHAKSLTVLLLILTTIVIPSAAIFVKATGSLYVNPGNITVEATGATFTVSAKTANMDQFNGWDIQVATDPTVINATDFSISRNIFTMNTTGGSFFEVVHCINGMGQGCQYGVDKPGIVHSAVAYTRVKASGNGLLFNVTYKVVNSQSFSRITIQNDIIANSGTSVQHTTTSGTYGTETRPDFDITANRLTLILNKKSSNITTVTLTSIQGFTGTIALTAILPSTAIGLSAKFTPGQAIIPTSGGTGESDLVVSADNTAQASSYVLTVSATSGTLVHTQTVTIQVKEAPDFAIAATPGELHVHQAASAVTIITVSSENGFNGEVQLQVQYPAGTAANLDASMVTVPTDGEVNVTLHVRVPLSITRFQDRFNITGVSGSISHAYPSLVIAEPPSGDFKIAINPAYTILQAGDTRVVTVGITSLDYYVGIIYLLGTTSSGLKLSFTPANFFLNYSRTVAVTLNITSDKDSSLGNHNITLTGIGQFQGTTTQHTAQLSLAISSSPVTPQAAASERLFLGLQAQFFYGLIISGIVVLAVLGILEFRRSSKMGSNDRPILEN